MQICSLTLFTCVCRYFPHLGAIINFDKEDYDWFLGSKHPQLLNYSGEKTLGENFSGNTDVGVATRSSIQARHPEKGLKKLVEIKKDLDKNCSAIKRQAEAQTLIGNIHSPEDQPIGVSSYAYRLIPNTQRQL